MATSTELLRAAEHMRSVFGCATTVLELECEAKRLQAVERAACPDITDDMFMSPQEVMQVIHDFTSHPGGATYMSDLRDDERQAVIDSMGSGFAPGSPRGWRDGRVAFSHIIDPTSRAPRCAGYMYHGDSVAIGCEPTCPGCLQWRSQNRSWPEGWPPFAVLRRAYIATGMHHYPSTMVCERSRVRAHRAVAAETRARWQRVLLQVLSEPSSP